MTAFMPACHACHCSAELHTIILAPAEDHGDYHLSEMFSLGPCQFCDCPNYTLSVPNPRTAYKIEGIS